MAVEIEFKDVDSKQVALECEVHARRGIRIGITNSETDQFTQVILNRETCAQLAKHLRRTIHEYDLRYGIDGKKRLTL